TRAQYTFAGQVVAQRETVVATGVATLVSLHTDHLGSVSAATSSSGAVVHVQTYTPWGEVRTGDIPQTTRDFTGQRRDGTGLLFYNARYYDPHLGLFLSPDTIVPGTASGAGGGAATVGPDAQARLAALTVGSHEPAWQPVVGALPAPGAACYTDGEPTPYAIVPVGVPVRLPAGRDVPRRAARSNPGHSLRPGCPPSAPSCHGLSDAPLGLVATGRATRPSARVRALSAPPWPIA
ncbi:MAG: RHS repeat-associated core domain-containing protein, partial [Chloroflexi bacterium]|nr:RHS repeat-associated core domain-containing protein [Chloroflexota bacterium]